METYSHSFFTWALAKHGVKASRAAGIMGAVGAALPDLPAIVGTFYFGGFAYLWEGWPSVASEAEAIYFTGPFGATGSALHSVVPVVLSLILYRTLKLGRWDKLRVVLWFLLGWLGHTVTDFLTHANDTRPLFWPITNWRWSSPVSYWDDAYYGQEFSAVSHGLILLVMVGLLLRRIFIGPRKHTNETDTSPRA